MATKLPCTYKVKEEDGTHTPCDCPNFVKHKGQDESDELRCRACKHFEGWHEGADDEEPSDTVKSILADCRVSVQSRKQKLKATEKEAEQEAIAGLKKDSESIRKARKTAVVSLLHFLLDD
jgi:hypothetical protein